MTHSTEWCEYIQLISFQNRTQAKQNAVPLPTPCNLQQVCEFLILKIIAFLLVYRCKLSGFLKGYVYVYLVSIIGTALLFLGISLQQRISHKCNYQIFTQFVSIRFSGTIPSDAICSLVMNNNQCIVNASTCVSDAVGILSYQHQKIRKKKKFKSTLLFFV